MIRSLLARRLVTGVSIVMLLLCQTAAAALACAYAPLAPPAAPAQAAAMDAAAPCHHDALDADGSAPEHGCQDRCPSRNFSSATAKVDIPAADSLAMSIFTVALPDAATTVTAPHEQILACAAPPHLILVYCRLLI